mmetsp:Transcript_23225/g.71423  ORF Transcript_23225/g.71423 Transcript_23225/m.71423 type:complete len:205 (-) Transcript_23225:440-1054(-)
MTLIKSNFAFYRHDKLQGRVVVVVAEDVEREEAGDVVLLPRRRRCSRILLVGERGTAQERGFGVDDVAGEVEVGRLDPVPDREFGVVGLRGAVPVLGDEVVAGVAEFVARGVEEDADAVLGAHLVHEDGPGLQLFQKVPLRVARQRRLEQMHVPGALVHQAHRRRPARPVLRRRPHGQREREALAPERSAIQAVQVRKHDVRVR